MYATFSVISSMMPEPAKTDAWRMAFLMAKASEEPWALMTGLEIPTRDVTTTYPASSNFLKWAMPSLTSRAASLVSIFFLNMPLSSLAKNMPVPSMVLRKMLPE